MFNKILIANRGEIACRIIRSAKKMGIRTVAVFSEADKNAQHVLDADEAAYIGLAPASDSYLSIDKIIEACKKHDVDAVHPGYGFLSEKGNFSEALEKENITFIGPPKDAINAMGDKITSKKVAESAGVSTIPGHVGVIDSLIEGEKIADSIGYPVMIKASAGGGGKGMRVARNASELKENFSLAKSEALKSFDDDRVFIEKFISNPRHIEIQILGDVYGNYVYLGERECSIQRRNQKVFEEAPSPFLKSVVRERMGEQAILLCKAVGYYSAGTVEFVVDRDQNFYFLEMNTRLQVEHPVTELVFGVDLVEEMIRLAAREKLPFKQEDLKPRGWALESRVYAEDPSKKFLPSVGRLTKYKPPDNSVSEDCIIRNDTGVFEGSEISIYYDPMIAKLCTWGPDRNTALIAMRYALDSFVIEGIAHNLSFLSALADNQNIISGEFNTNFLEKEYKNCFSPLDLPDNLRLQFAIIAVCVSKLCQSEFVEPELSVFHGNQPKSDLIVSIGESHFKLSAKRYATEFVVMDEKNREWTVNIDWNRNTSIARSSINGEERVSKIKREGDNLLINYRGFKSSAKVQTLREAELRNFLIQREPEDVSKLLLCPMPGLLISLNVSVGDKVTAGQPLCIIEAMKMENVLRAEKNGIIRKINFKAGLTLNVNDVIIEYE
ncbi:MAG: acetyl/propionyl/methylcrotonyl-CoA carboxylase subunit alpha [Pseudomonadota bacterium]|nr:acetyl/propionyl/methylcrotonyl-CoA carboxylase subunit alpha [Pseudomonadota bacterium]